MYHFGRVILTGVLVVHRKSFASAEKAHEWNKRTGICLNLDLISREEINAWEGEIIWVPLKEEE